MKAVEKVWPLIVVVLVAAAVVFYSASSNMALNKSEAVAATRDYGSAKFIRVAVNDQPAFSGTRVINNQPLVPIRAIAQASGATLNWNAKDKSIIVTYKEQTIKAAICSEKAEVNNKAVSLQAAPMLVDGETLLPLSLIEESLELQSSWNEAAKTLYITTRDYKPAPTTAEKRSDVQYVPILMYHQLGDGPNSLYVRDSEFYEQMTYLKEHNFRVLNLSDAVRKMQNGEPMDKTIVITFDDGYETFFSKAYPLLRTYHFPATVFIITAQMEDGWYLSWEQSKILYAGWMEIGSHTKNHHWLAKQSRDVYTDEIFDSKKIIEEQLQVPCEVFCYPGGSYNNAVSETVKEAGYLTAVTTVQGKTSINSDIYQMPRIRVPRGMSLKAFAKSIN
ncbi:MAG: polysaccharide deacetylase family protein [Syntrophomonadaceae bacterium]